MNQNQPSLNGNGAAKRPSVVVNKERLARNVSKRLGQSHVVIVTIDVEANEMDVISYGRTEHEQAQAQALAKIAYDAVYDELVRRTNGDA